MSSFAARVLIEIQERNARYEKLLALAREIAPLLGSDWTAQPAQISEGDDSYISSHRNTVYFENRDGREFRVSIDQHRPKDNRLTISGCYEYGDSDLGLSMPRNKTAPEITVAMTRGAVIIAAEIRRRFLTEYTELRAYIDQMVAEHTAHRDHKKGIVERLAKLAGADPRRIGRNEFSTYHQTLPYVEARVYSDVTLEIHNLTEAQAAAVISYIGAIPKD